MLSCTYFKVSSGILLKDCNTFLMRNLSYGYFNPFIVKQNISRKTTTQKTYDSLLDCCKANILFTTQVKTWDSASYPRSFHVSCPIDTLLHLSKIMAILISLVITSLYIFIDYYPPPPHSAFLNSKL